MPSDDQQNSARTVTLPVLRPWHAPSPIEEQSRVARTLNRPVCDLADGVPKGITVARRPATVDFSDYPDARGVATLRRLIAERENAKYGTRLTEENIVVTNGATEALFLLVHAFVAPGDAVRVHAPSVFLYRDVIENHGARLVPTNGPDDDGARLWLVHNPSNPAGTVLERDALRGLIEEASAHGSPVVLDQVYDELLYGVTRTPEEQHLIDTGRVVKINSVSKAFGAAGLRIGWITCSLDLAAILSGIGERLRLGVSVVSQLEAEQLLAMPLDTVAKLTAPRRALVRSWLETCPALSGTPPAAGIFYWLELHDSDANEVCQRAFQQERVWLMAGPSFWRGSDRHLRLSFAAPPEVVEEGLRRLTRVL